MLYSTLLSTALIAASPFGYATPVPTEEKLAEKAKVIPFVNKHAAARNSENYSPFARNERIAAIKRSGEKVTRSERKAAALEPYDIGPNSLYYGDLSVGTPAQVMTIDFDTGSSDLIIPSSDCTKCVSPLYNPSTSTSFTNLNTAFNTSFVDGSAASGVLATDTVSLGSLSVANQGFAVISDFAWSFARPMSGLMGLAFESAAQTKATPWFFNLANQGALASNLFSFYLTRQRANGSELCIGCIDSTKFTGQPEYFPLVPGAVPGFATQALWDIISDGATYNNAVVTQPFTAIIDSAFYANIPGAQLHSNNKYYVFPCTSAAKIGQVGFRFRGSSSVFNIPPSRFILGRVEKGSDMCAGAILSSGSEDGIAYIGDAFMSSWYSIFDYGNMRVGFAQAV
ncbi:Type I transmembrane sorting receptor [Tulasnella sp. UAMH 9824]|nr:Type I transmembrane sorting receptor [Tulasnella sp. UAMH 9824]